MKHWFWLRSPNKKIRQMTCHSKHWDTSFSSEGKIHTKNEISLPPITSNHPYHRGGAHIDHSRPLPVPKAFNYNQGLQSIENMGQLRNIRGKQVKNDKNSVMTNLCGSHLRFARSYQNPAQIQYSARVQLQTAPQIHIYQNPAHWFAITIMDSN